VVLRRAVPRTQQPRLSTLCLTFQFIGLWELYVPFMRFILFSGSELPNRTRNFCLVMLPTCQQKNKIDGANNPSNSKRS